MTAVLENTDVAVLVDVGAGMQRIDGDQCVRRMSWGRGKARRIGRTEAGDLTIELDNRNGNLVPGNPASVWPLDIGTPIRVDVTHDGTTTTEFAGTVDELDPDWDLGDAWCSITATDRLAVLARTRLPDSVFAHVVAGQNPVGWWPLADTIPGYVEGRVGPHGTTSGDPQTGGESLLDLEPQTSSMSFLDLPQARVELGEAAAITSSSGGISAWFACVPKPGGTVGRHHWIWRQFNTTVSLNFIDVYVRGAGTDPGVIEVLVADGTNPLSVYAFRGTTRVDDGARHHVIARWLQQANGQWVLRVYIDGQIEGDAVSSSGGPIAPGTGDVFLGNREVVIPAGDGSPVGDGWQLNGRLQHVVAFDGTDVLDDGRVLTAEALAQYAGGTVDGDPVTHGGGESTGARISRILDITGDTAPRSINAGTVACSAAILRGDLVLDYIARVVDTEGPDAWFLAVGDGTLTFHDAGAAVPAFPTIDSSDQFGNVPYRDATPRYTGTRSYDRVEIRRDGGNVRAAGAAVTDSTSTLSVDTIHDTAADAAAAAAEWFAAVGDGRLELERAELQAERDDVPWPAVLAVEPAHTVQVLGRPPGAPVIDQPSVVTRIGHDVDYSTFTWRLRLNTETDYRGAPA